MGIPHNVGTADAACAVKLISNMVGMANLAILSEGLKLGEAAGLPPSTLLQLLEDTGARSFQMDVRGPWLADRDYVPRFALALAHKDMRLGCAMAGALGLHLPAMETAQAYFAAAEAAGHATEDCGAIFKIVDCRESRS